MMLSYDGHLPILLRLVILLFICSDIPFDGQLLRGICRCQIIINPSEQAEQSLLELTAIDQARYQHGRSGAKIVRRNHVGKRFLKGTKLSKNCLQKIVAVGKEKRGGIASRGCWCKLKSCSLQQWPQAVQVEEKLAVTALNYWLPFTKKKNMRTTRWPYYAWCGWNLEQMEHAKCDV